MKDPIKVLCYGIKFTIGRIWGHGWSAEHLCNAYLSDGEGPAAPEVLRGDSSRKREWQWLWW